jgi:hypothetical protein
MASSSRVSGTAKSKGKVMKKDVAGEKGSAVREPGRSRAQRNQTPEARAQQARAPKTHYPTRAVGAQRKDRKGPSAGADLR